MDLPLPDHIVDDAVAVASDRDPHATVPDGDPAVASDRDRVIALVGSGPAVGTLLVPSINSAAPIGRLDPTLEAKLAARSVAALDLQGQDYPTRHIWSRTIGNATPAVAVVAVILVIGIVADATFWIVFSSALLVCLFVLIGLNITRVVRDPYRLTRAQRRALHRAGHWRSKQPWDGYTSTRPEFRLVREAAKAAAQVANSRAWTSGYLDQHRARLDLGGELDRIDEQAFQLARAQLDIASAPVGSGLGRYNSALAPVWLAAVDRVGALLRYADHVAALDRQMAELATFDRAEEQIGRLIGGSVQDEFGTEQLRQLTGELGYLQLAVRDTTLLLQSDAQAIGR